MPENEAFQLILILFKDFPANNFKSFGTLSAYSLHFSND